MHFTKLPFDAYVEGVDRMLTLVQGSQDLLMALARFGYNTSRLAEGRKVFGDLVDLHQKQEAVMQAKMDAHEARKQLQVAVRKDYMKMLQIARVVYDKDPVVSKALQLDGARAINIDAWIDQVELFCSRLIKESRWQQVLQQYGILLADLEKLLARAQSLREVSLQCDQLKQDAKLQTAQKKKQLKVLQDWVSDFMKIAKIALEDRPHWYARLKNPADAKIKQ